MTWIGISVSNLILLLFTSVLISIFIYTSAPYRAVIGSEWRPHLQNESWMYKEMWKEKTELNKFVDINRTEKWIDKQIKTEAN